MFIDIVFELLGWVLLLLFVLLPLWLIVHAFSNKTTELFPTPQKVEPYLPYHAKKYFFSQSEQMFFNILNSHLDAHRYTIFPKVRLGDFIEVDHQDRRDRTWWNKIRAKHIDYLIWDLVENKIMLAIELDGNSHSSIKMQQRDKFVDELYVKVGIKLERVRVGSSFEEESLRLVEML